MEKYTLAAHSSAGLAVLFSGLTLYEWAFVIGIFLSIILGVLTFIVTLREQRKRTKIFQSISDKLNPKNPSATVKTLIDIATKSPRDI